LRTGALIPGDSKDRWEKLSLKGKKMMQERLPMIPFRG
jgi:hypothetical protein